MRFLTLSVMSIAALFSAGFDSRAGTLEEIAESGVLRVGFREDEPPMSFVNGDGDVGGYSIDLCTRIANEVGATLELSELTINFVPVTAANRFSALVDGEIDILCGSTTKTIARSELVDFTQLTFVTGGSLLALDGEGAVEAIAGLEGKKVAVVDGTTTIGALDNALTKASIAAETVVVADADEGFALLLSGEVDAFTADQVVLIGLVLEHEGEENFVVSSELFSFEPFALAVRQNDSAFRLVADRVLSNLSRTGEIVSIYDEWFGSFSKEMPELLEALYILNSTPR